MLLLEDFIAKRYKIGIIGLGSVGMMIVRFFAKKFKIIGYDVNPERIEHLKTQFPADGNIEFTDDKEKLRQARFFIIAAPTPVDRAKQPDLSAVMNACSTVAQVLKPGDVVVLESTVFPGFVSRQCVPELERLSGLKLNKDFKVGYSPERINPGDKLNTFDKVTKVVAGSDARATELIASVYAQVVEKIHIAPSIETAETAKLLENIQRDVNIALMNEFVRICEKMNIDFSQVLEAAATKWNFARYSPGLVGGHCIAVDPYYLIYKAQESGVYPGLIATARQVNESFPEYLAGRAVGLLAQNNLPVAGARVLILGFAYKENVSDIRNTKVAELVLHLRRYNITVDIYDPLVDQAQVRETYNLMLLSQPAKKAYQMVIVAVLHDEFKHWDEQRFVELVADNKAVVFDLKGFFKNKIKHLTYQSF